MSKEVMPVSVFDNSQAIAINQARQAFLNDLILDLKKLGLTTALDVGCGFGYFSGYLRASGFTVTAFDARPENVAEASQRNPEVDFIVHDVEDRLSHPSVPFDLVLCLGLLYHLENPFRAVRNLAEITRKVLVVSTMIAPGRSPGAILSDEWRSENQGINYMALIPTESCFVKMLYRAGFPYVYQCSYLPAHKDFRASLLFKRIRTVLIASKIELQHPILNLAHESKQMNRFFWYRFGLGRIRENERLAKAVRRLLHHRHDETLG